MPPTDGFEVLAAASSAGGVNGLVTLLGAADAGLPVPVLVVQHLAPAIAR